MDIKEQMKQKEQEQLLFNAEFRRQFAAVKEWMNPEKGDGLKETTKMAIRDLQKKIGPLRCGMGFYSLIFGGFLDNGETYDGIEFLVDPDELIQEICQFILEHEAEQDELEAKWDKKHNRGLLREDKRWKPFKRARKKIRQVGKLAQRTILEANNGNPNGYFDGDSDYLV